MTDENKQKMTISEFAEQVLGLQLSPYQKNLLETLYKKCKEPHSIPLTAISRGGNYGALGYISIITFYDEFIGENSDVHADNRGAMDQHTRIQ